MVLDSKIAKKLHKAIELKLDGENDQSVIIFEKLLESRPYLPSVLKPLSELYVAQMQYQKAVEMYERILAVEDEEDLDGFFYVNYANSLKFSGKYAIADENFIKAIELIPNNPSILVEYAQYKFDLELFEEAIDLYEKALLLDKNHVIALIGKAIVLSKINEVVEAEILMRKALVLYPNNPYALEGLIRIYIFAKKYEEAEELLIKSINIYPEMVILRMNQGLVYMRTNRLELALQSYNAVLSINSNVKMAKISKAYILTQLNQFDEALIEYDSILESGIDYDVIYKKSFTELQLGRFEAGWKNHEARLKLEKYIYYTPAVKNMGKNWHRSTSNLDKSLLVYSEQGLGDVIQMSRYIKMLVDDGMQVIFHVDKNLYPLFKAMPSIAHTIVEERPVSYSQYVSIMSLPYEFRTTEETIPSPLAIELPKSCVIKWEKKLGESKNKRIGIVNSGNPKHINDYNRSVLLSELIQSLPIDAEYFLLQKDLREVDLEFIHSSECKYTIHIMSEHLTSFIDTACLCALMDQIIGVDTSVIHLAGTLAKPTIVLLPYVPDWRWLLNKKNTAWYPNVTLIRQNKYGSWENVWEELQQLI